MSVTLKSSVVIIFCTLLIYSCKKSDNTQGTTSAPKVKTYIEQVTNFSNTVSDTFNVNYDNSDRIVSLIALSSGSQFLYTYNGTSSYVMEIKKGSHVTIHVVNYLNSNSLIDTTFQYNDTNDSTTFRMVYNSSSQLVEQKQYSYSLSKGIALFARETFTYNTEGNVVTHTQLAPAGTTNYTETYTYTNYAGTNFGYGAPYAPPMYKKLPATLSVYYPGSNQTVVSNFTYVFDGSNRLIKATQINSGGNSLVKQFGY